MLLIPYFENEKKNAHIFLTMFLNSGPDQNADKYTHAHKSLPQYGGTLLILGKKGAMQKTSRHHDENLHLDLQ